MKWKKIKGGRVRGRRMKRGKRDVMGASECVSPTGAALGYQAVQR
jgi:hypothetical protein